MKPASFRYHRPHSLVEALGLLAKLEDAKLIAGGQSLGPMMNMRLLTPAELIDLNEIAGLDSIQESSGFLEIGAMARHHAVATSAIVKKHCALLAEAAGTIGHYAIRSRGTLGGSLAHADPAAQLPLVAATLGAEIVANGKRGERRIPAREFFVSVMTTALAPDEMVVSVRFPRPAPGDSHAYMQFSRRTGDFAIVAVAAVLDAKGLRVGVGGVEDRPAVIENIRSGDPAVIGQMAREVLHPAENPRIPAIYRRELVEVLVKRAVQKCLNSS
jgi:carbon-monoxide dehydrogenase medium subunit